MKINQLKTGAVLSYMSMGLGYFISILYTPIMLRLLGQSEYGLYNLVASIVAYLGILKFGFGNAYVRYYSEYKVKDEKNNIAKLNGMFLIIFSVMGLLAVVAGMILVVNADHIFGSELTFFEVEKAKTLMFILVINLALSFPNIVFTSHITANERFVFQKVLQMVRTVVNPFIVLPVLLMGYGSVGMVAATTLLNFSIEMAGILFCKRRLDMKFSFVNFDFKLMKEMIVFSSFIFINIIVDQVNWNVDKFIIGRFYGTTAVAVYGLAAQLNTYYLSMSSAISSVFIPRVHKLVVVEGGNNDLTKLFTKIGRIQFMLLSLIATGLLFLGRPFIILWAGKNYDGSYPIALLLILPVTIPLIQNIGIEIQRAKNMHQFRSWVYLFIAIGNVIISIPLTMRFGGIGAAIGTAVSLIIGNGFLMNWYNHSKVGLDMIFFWNEIISFAPSLILPLISGIVLNRIFDLYSIPTFLFSGLIYVSIFGLSIWKFGMNEYEKDLLGRPFIKFIKKLKCLNKSK